ncbi:MAG: hypothetical protein JRF56_19235 [Deltaproteobacteria bacterium]|jgi:lipopolysaccharide export LptBFGC system permease protein LptF|nr:hypothetical protein [Deltaproteobacteria bacterium]
MSEKTYNESETLAEHESSIDGDTGSDEKFSEIKGSLEEHTATEEIVEKLENKDNVMGDDPTAQSQNEPETNDADEETGYLAEGKTSRPPAKKNQRLKRLQRRSSLPLLFPVFSYLITSQ